MSKISPKNIAEAIYLGSHGKSGIELDNVLKRSAKMLQDKRMLGKSEDILSLLQNMVDKKEGIIRMKVTTAKSINHEEKKNLEEEIKQKYKAQKVISEYFEKEEVLGGMKVEVGYEVLDNTYKSKLQKLEKFLIQSK
jgi:F-type H+-transporting ATPase subunit delta